MKLFRRNLSTVNDDQLLAEYRQSGDSRLIGEVYKRYMHLVYSVCLKYLRHDEDSRDAVMEIFEKLIKSLREHEVQNFRSWLYSVAKNHCLMRLRQTSRLQMSDKPVENFENTNLIVENQELLHLLGDGHSRAERLEEIRSAILTLREEQQICLNHFYFEGYSYQEVADNTGFSVNQVKSFIQNGKRNLKNMLSGKGKSDG